MIISRFLHFDTPASPAAYLLVSIYPLRFYHSLHFVIFSIDAKASLSRLKWQYLLYMTGHFLSVYRLAISMRSQSALHMTSSDVTSAQLFNTHNVYCLLRWANSNKTNQPLYQCSFIMPALFAKLCCLYPVSPISLHDNLHRPRECSNQPLSGLLVCTN